MGIDVTNLHRLTSQDMGSVLSRYRWDAISAQAFCVLLTQWLDHHGVTGDGWLLEFQPRLGHLLQLLQALDDDTVRDVADVFWERIRQVDGEADLEVAVRDAVDLLHPMAGCG